MLRRPGESSRRCRASRVARPDAGESSMQQAMCPIPHLGGRRGVHAGRKDEDGAGGVQHDAPDEASQHLLDTSCV